MAKELLKIEDLSVSFNMGSANEVKAVKNISFSINKGEMLAIVGESGSGKSVSALSILRLLPYPLASHPSGSIIFDGEDLMQKKPESLCDIRGNNISMIFQEPMTSLNALHSIEKQIAEAISIHNPGLAKKAIKDRIVELLSMVELDELKDRMHSYPHELSGGQRQRVMIAMALANDPDILIADEPTTALDVTVQVQILTLIKDLQKNLGMAIILITHDLTIVENIADRVAVMHEGEIVEQGDVSAVFSNPQHKYTKHLLSCTPGGEPDKVSSQAKEILKACDLKVHFPVKKGSFGRVRSYIKAVDGISLDIRAGETIGVVGESGSGKSTLAFALLRLVKSTGSIVFNGNELQGMKSKQLRPLRKEMQFVFQDPFSSLNPRLPISQIIGEGLLAHDIGESKEEQNDIIDAVLTDVGLDPEIKTRYPHEFSGGQRQRIGVARALVLKPSFIALDEPTSALDISTQTEILHMLKNLQKQYSLAFMFISHDLRVIKSISHKIIVMKQGKVIESGSNHEIFSNPQTDYTKTLISAAFNIA